MLIHFECRFGGTHPHLGDVWHRVAFAQGEDAERYTRYVCNTLSSVARTPEECKYVSEVLETVRTGQRTTATVEGQDVTLTATATHVQVNIEINEKWVGATEGRFPLSEYIAALHAWQDLLSMPEGPASRISLKLDHSS